MKNEKFLFLMTICGLSCLTAWCNLDGITLSQHFAWRWFYGIAMIVVAVIAWIGAWREAKKADEMEEQKETLPETID
jgi:prolipoprotein diacylglyceryltransferase